MTTSSKKNKKDDVAFPNDGLWRMEFGCLDLAWWTSSVDFGGLTFK